MSWITRYTLAPARSSEPEIRIVWRPRDVVVVRYVESVIVKVRPDAPEGGFRDSTEDARRAGDTDVVQQLTAVVTVESIDPAIQLVVYRTPDNRRVARTVTDARLLEGIKAGDRVEITLTRARAVSIEKSRASTAGGDRWMELPLPRSSRRARRVAMPWIRRRSWRR